MATVRTIVGESRRSLNTYELASLYQMVEAYRIVWGVITRELTALQEQIALAQSQGVEVTATWLYRQPWFTASVTRIERELAAFEPTMVQLIALDQRFGLTTAVDTSGRIQTDLAARGVNFANTSAEPVVLDTLVSALSPSSPVRKAIERYGPRILDRIIERVIAGVGMGLSAASITTNISRDVGPEALRPRFHTMVRTEIMRAYRSAFELSLRRDYKAGVVVGYQWVASLSSRTCPACLARHNRIYPTYPSGHHVNCRCVVIPIINPEYVPPVQPGISGDQWLREQPAYIQRKVLGTSERYEAFADGWSLDSFAGEVKDKVWGTQIVTLPMSQARRQT